MDLINEFLTRHFDSKYLAGFRTQREKFVKKYTSDRILNLTQEEYHYSGKENTFCYSLEYGLGALASMGNAFPSVFGVYVAANHELKMSSHLQKIYRNDYAGALTYQKKQIVSLIKAGNEKNYRAIENSTINQQFRFKILSIYCPNSFFPVCTRPTAEAYCKIAGLRLSDNASMLDLNLALVKWAHNNLPHDWDLFQSMYFIDWLWRDDRKFDYTTTIKTSSTYADSDNQKLVSEFNRVNEVINDPELEGADRLAIVKTRVNQGVFRDRLIRKYKKCCLCGVDAESMLISSHIKPWSDSTPAERTSVDNGLLLCPNHDRLFDQGFISFDDTGKIIISSLMNETNRIFLNINDEMAIDLNSKTKEFMRYHREKIYKA